MSQAEEGHSRQPLPAPEEIAKLPSDGGEEFNRLVFEQSPYLLQHARNPVDWWPWSDEAFELAKKEDKPVFLSVGYTTCHWCHVMEHESFEDEEVAALINEHYVPIKVDREERPDIDEVYMQITQAITGGGGWPMTVVMTPDKHAFFAGTYFPKQSAPGRPGILRVASELHKAWVERREEVEQTALNISAQMSQMMGASPGGDLDPGIFDMAYADFATRFDENKGGFASAPKFPVPPNLMFLTRFYHRTGNSQALEMVEKTLTEMRRGGIYDHIGFGIHRYATDPDWLVPHFEKMLYDQALVTMAYLEAYQITGKERYARTAREILTYVERDMTSPEGGFYSAEDADSEGEEGKFYVWSNAEILEVLGQEEGEFFIETFHFEEAGNFLEEATRVKTGTNIPHLKEELLDEARERVEALRLKLFEHRKKRVHPQKDDKVLTDWNGLMISAFARAAQVLGDESYDEIATRAAEFVLVRLRDDEGRLLKRYRGGEAGLTAHLEDYAFMIWGLLDLYETNFDLRYLEQAITFQEMVDDLFWDETEGGYFTVADDAEQLIVRAKKLYGGAIPSGNSVQMGNLIRLSRMTGRPHFSTRGDELIRAFSAEIEQNSMVYPLALMWLDFQFGPAYEIVISGGDAAEMIGALQTQFLPNKTILRRTEENAERLAKIAPFTEGQASRDGEATAYVCQNFACQLPTTQVDEMMKMILGEASAPKGSTGQEGQ
ncbi:MAG: thioredoxin domain-containing protein [Verrucomicrobiota bacterium]